MRVVLACVLLFALALFAQQGMMPGPGTTHSTGGGGATAALVQHPTKVCGAGATCSVTLTQSIGTGNFLIIGAMVADSGTTITSINVGGTLVPCTVGAGGCGFFGGAAFGASAGGWVLSTTSTAGPVVITWSQSISAGFVGLREYSCSGGTVSHDIDGTVNSTTNTSPYAGVALTLSGTNDVIMQWSDGVTVDPTSISTYTTFDSASGPSFANLINTVSGAAPNWTAAGNSGGDTGAAIAMKCQ